MNINIDQQGISRIENNTRIVTDYELACLCRALGVTVEEMLADFFDKAGAVGRHGAKISGTGCGRGDFS